MAMSMQKLKINESNGSSFTQFFLTDLVYLKNFSNFYETNTKL